MPFGRQHPCRAVSYTHLDVYKRQYGTCLNAVDDTMMPYAYELTPGQERSDWLMAEIPEGSTSCTIAYQEYKTDGSKGDAYFVEAAL